ncbi:Fe-S cluster assembly ATPase SufC [Candidatus Woesearchaeota archaeon]|nr:Fe-S cluster assembly ATPase SufC [Candidatus Woesearchaeota archaeon]
MKKLEIIDLHVEVNGTEIIKGVTLTFLPGKVHALMGPNGSGKSTLANAIMGHPKYKITKGRIMLDGKDITKEKANVRAKEGIFLSFQYPAEITGVTISNFLRTAVNNKREKKLSIIDFHNLLKEKMAELKMDPSFNKRYLNAGFSGGEKKRAEILQLAMLEPKYALLDETDSGLDIDSIKIVAEGIEKVRKQKAMGIILITHYQRILEYLTPDEVSILYKGKIIQQGGKELAKKIESEGFEGIIKK